MEMHKCGLIILMVLASFTSGAQDFTSANIRTAKLYKRGDQTAFPMIVLNSSDALELDFDDLDNTYKNYYYTFQLCNWDWTPSDIQAYTYVKGFQNVKISDYRNSSVSNTRYMHYQALIPDRNSYPAMPGNYLLKVYLDNDTSNLVFTKRFLVVQNQTTINGLVQQPIDYRLNMTSQKLKIVVQTSPNMQMIGPNDLKLVVLQNKNWQTSMTLDKPAVYRGNYFEYNDDATTVMPGIREFRWLDLRSFRLLGDRVTGKEERGKETHVFVKTDLSRVPVPYTVYQDMDGSFTVMALEDINPFYQSDYAFVHFTYIPPGNRALEGRNLYLFGELTDFALDTAARMNFNADKGVYEKTLLLKQGYYNYMYVTQPLSNGAYPDMSETEGNFWQTENSYTILVYYRPIGARADQLIGFTTISSIFQRAGL